MGSRWDTTKTRTNLYPLKKDGFNDLTTKLTLRTNHPQHVMEKNNERCLVKRGENEINGGNAERVKERERHRENKGKQKSISLTAFFNNSVLWRTGRTELNETGEQLACHTHTHTHGPRHILLWLTNILFNSPGPDPCLLIRIWSRTHTHTLLLFFSWFRSYLCKSVQSPWAFTP